MLPIDINMLLEQREVESSRIEYKKDWNPAECIRTICAFANDIEDQDGGYILIGVEEENGRPILPVSGINPERIDTIEKDLLNKCHFIEPFYYPRIEKCQIDDKTILVLWVTAGPGRPYMASKDVFREQSIKQYYIRHGSKTIQADKFSLKELFEKSAHIPFDDRENPFASIEDISMNLIKEHLYEVKSRLYDVCDTRDKKDIAQDMKLLYGPDENLRPRNIALLMFSEKINDYFPYARIEFADIPDPTGRNMSERTFSGPLQNQLRSAIEYIKNSVIEEKIRKTDNEIITVRTLNYPIDAIKELLANAIYHRSYQVSEPITIINTPEYIEIRSFPGLDRSISAEMIEALNIRSTGEYMNRRIGNFLKELGLTEGRNTGIPRAIEALDDNENPNPLFITDPERRSLTVRILINPAFTSSTVSIPSSIKNMERKDLKNNIIAFLTAGPMSRRDLALKLGYKGITTSFTQAVEELIQKHAIRSEGKGRGSRLILNKK